MKKLLAAILTAIAPVILPAADLYSFLPAGTETVLEIKCERLQNSALYREIMRRFPDAVRGVRLPDCNLTPDLAYIRNILIFDSDSDDIQGLLIECPSVTPANFRQILRRELQIKPGKYGQKEIFYLKSHHAPEESGSYAATFIAPGVILTGEADEVHEVMKKDRLTPAEQKPFRIPLPSNGVAGLYSMDSGKGGRITGRLLLTGAEGSGIQSNAVLHYPSAAKAAEEAQNFRYFVQIAQMLSTEASRNQQLAAELFRCLKIENQSNTVKMYLNIPPSLVVRALDEAAGLLPQILMPPDEGIPPLFTEK